MRREGPRPTGRLVIEPNRLGAERVQERSMRVAIIGGHARRQWTGPRPDDCLMSRCGLIRCLIVQTNNLTASRCERDLRPVPVFH